MNNMKRKDLKPGNIYKDFSELCSALNVKPKGGGTKKRILEDLAQYVNYSTEGRKYIIHEVYANPVISVKDKRTCGNNNLYAKYIELILTQYLAIDHHNEEVCLTKQELWEILGMINPKFGKYAEENTFIQQHPEIRPIDIMMFKSSANYKMTQVLDTALKSLRNKRLLSFFTEVVIIPTDICKDEYIASYDDVQIIDAIEQEVLDSMGFRGVYQIYNANKDKEFYSLVNEQLLAHGWSYTYRRYRLVYTQQNMIKEIPRLEIEINNKMQLNQNLIVYLNNKCKSDYESFQEGCGSTADGKAPSDIYHSKYFHECCIMNHSILAEEFIKYIFDPEVRKS